jgi:hypothetical protein
MGGDEVKDDVTGADTDTLMNDGPRPAKRKHVAAASRASPSVRLLPLNSIDDYKEELEHEEAPVEHKEGTSEFSGVSWDTSRGRWRAECCGKTLGHHATEWAAAGTYNIEAGYLGLPLNVISPAGDGNDSSNTASPAAPAAAAAAPAAPAAAPAAAPPPAAPAAPPAAAAAPATALALPSPAALAHARAGAAPKRAASTTPAAPQTKTRRLDNLAGAAGAVGAAASGRVTHGVMASGDVTAGGAASGDVTRGGAPGARAATAAAAQGAALQARVKVSKAKAEVAGLHAKVGRCRLTVSKPVLKAPMVSAVERTI